MRRATIIFATTTVFQVVVSLIIPTLHSVDRISAGERRIARILNSEWKNSANGIVWYTPTIGPKGLQPDFVVLDPNAGLVVLEVKEWKADTVTSCDPNFWKLSVDGCTITKQNPLQQARKYAQAIHSVLESEPNLVNPPDHPYAGRLCFPYGYGVIFTNLSRKRDSHLLDTFTSENIFCVKDEDGPILPWRRCLQYTFGQPLSLGQVNRIRGILFPELIIRQPIQERLSQKTTKPDDCRDCFFRIMDIKQELLARSLGSGHRVIHGVSGSGKTLILQCRVKYLINQTNEDILVLCYNQILATKLRETITRMCPQKSNVKVHNFHQWCRERLLFYHLPLPDRTRDTADFAKELFRAVKDGVESGKIPVGAYHSILVDEVHDFAPEWIQLLTQQVSPTTKSLLLVYDDAQNLYKHHGSNFSFRSVGVNAVGRTNILQINYRNPQQIIQFAYNFVEPFRQGLDSEVIVPQSAGRPGEIPILFRGTTEEQELYMIRQSLSLLLSGYQLSDIAVLCRTKRLCQRVIEAFRRNGLACELLAKRGHTSAPCLKVVTMHSSKGLEFPIVFIPCIDSLPVREEGRLSEEARLLYVAMTRATEKLYMLKTSIRNSSISAQLLKGTISIIS